MKQWDCRATNILMYCSIYTHRLGVKRNEILLAPVVICCIPTCFSQTVFLCYQIVPIFHLQFFITVILCPAILLPVSTLTFSYLTEDGLIFWCVIMTCVLGESQSKLVVYVLCTLPQRYMLSALVFI